jgi:methylmalonyl-CoA mutase
MHVETIPPPGANERKLLLREFAAATPAAWRAATEALLKGAPFEKKLVTRTPEGIELQPIYHACDIAGLAPREYPGAGSRRRGGRAAGHLVRAWDVSQELRLPTPETFNAAARHELACGQTELNIGGDRATLAGLDPDHTTPEMIGADGVSLATLADLERALADISLPMISVYLRAGAAALPAAALLFALARKRGMALRELRGCVGCDPLGVLAQDGTMPTSLDHAWREMAVLTRFAVRHAPALQTIVVNGHSWHDAGATAVQELAFVLATGVEYLRLLETRELPVDAAAPHVRFALAAGGDFFMEVAKFRAARQVWAQAVRAMGGGADAQAMYLHARTATRNQTSCDAHNNVLRGTTAGLAAVLGGCDSLHVSPFDEVSGVPDERSRRIARNTQIILAEECDLTHVIDPGGGSYYIEWLTEQVARRAWTLFQEIERTGGMTAALAGGMPQKLVAEAAAGRARAVAQRRAIIVGANQYPNIHEAAPERARSDPAVLHRQRAGQVAAFRAQFSAEPTAAMLDSFSVLFASSPAQAFEMAIDAASHGATLGDIARALRGEAHATPRVPPIATQRTAQPFECLREASSRHRSRTGGPPLVFQANLGSSRLFRARADWVSGFFAVGGFKVSADRDFSTVDEAAAAAADSGARVVVLTAPDETYLTAVEPFTRALKTRVPDIQLLVAGTPREHEAAWRAAGVDEFVNVASNALELLTNLLSKIKVLP